jgi:hypothetical protein
MEQEATFYNNIIIETGIQNTKGGLHQANNEKDQDAKWITDKADLGR